MTQTTMTEIEKTSSSQNQGMSLDSTEIRAIQLADGWHNVRDCKVVPFAVSNSPVYSFYASLNYTNEFGQNVFTPLSKIISYSAEQSTK